jgi:hypothetical protein
VVQSLCVLNFGTPQNWTMNRFARLNFEPLWVPATSLLTGLNSLFLSTGNLSLCLWKGWGICDPIAPEKSDIGKFPCISPAHQGSDRRDEFALASPHRH